jgi:toxin ParE1/3/4
MKVRFHREADAELVEAQAWYRERSEVASQALALEIDAAIELILEAPSRWPQKRRGEHRFVLKRFPYTIIYRIREDHVFVTAVAHHSRRPNYWRHRK